jgi:hypothetical protein
MADAQTLSIGQAGYTLNPATPPEPGSSITAASRGTTASRIFDVRSAASQGPLIQNLGIGANNGAAYTAVQTSTVNVYDATSGLQANLGDGRDTLNLFAAADGASVELDATQVSAGGGNDLLNAQSDFINSSVAAGLGNDTVRIGGTANGSSFYLGGGNDSLYLVGSSEGVYVNGDAGSDTLFFVGTQTNALVYGGDGADSITFLNGTPGGNSGLVGTYEFGSAGVDSGSGNDTIVFGINSSSDNFALNTGIGSDVVQLNSSISDAQISLGSDVSGAKGDSLSMTGTMFNSSIASGNTGGDVLVFGAGSSVTNTSFALGGGNDSLVFGSTVYGDISSPTLISLGGGNNTLTFGATSYVDGYNIDLANGLADTISFQGSFGDNVIISGANTSDVLYVGSSQYSYVAADNFWENIANSSDTIRFA